MSVINSILSDTFVPDQLIKIADALCISVNLFMDIKVETDSDVISQSVATHLLCKSHSDKAVFF